MTAPNFPLTPSKPGLVGAALTGSQRNRRWTDTFFDNHKHPTKFPNGRPFTGEREMRSGTEERSESAGFITPDLQCGEYFCENPAMGQTQQERIDTLNSTWSAPWIPLAKYFRFNFRNKRITFAYEKMIADEREGLARYWEAASKLAGENDVIDPDHPNKVPFRIRTLLGVPQQYTGKIRLAQAAMAGDPWLLGFVEEPNVELAKILGTKVNFLGGHTSDREFTETRIVEAQPLTTPETVLGADASQLAAIMKQMEEMAAELKVLRANQKKPATKKPTAKPSTPAAPEAA